MLGEQAEIWVGAKAAQRVRCVESAQGRGAFRGLEPAAFPFRVTILPEVD